MALYVVVHHQRDGNQPWKNAWLSDELIEAIQTTNEIGQLCRWAKERNERVYVHRCGWGDCAPVISCSAEVEVVAGIDKTTVLARFAGAAAVDVSPPQACGAVGRAYLASDTASFGEPTVS